jgi:thiosulfate/3-mercaptopyruvate sulfurtransferase
MMLHRIAGALLLTFGTALASACGGDRPAGDQRGDAATSASATAGAEPALRSELLVQAPWLAERLDIDDVVVLHVGGEAEEYERAHIPGARHLPVTALNQERDGIPNVLPPRDELARSFAAAGVSEGSHVVVYGAPLAAARAFMALEYLGHPRVSLLDGGLPAWQAAGATAPARAERTAAGNLSPRGNGDVVVDAAWVLERLDDPSIALIDARPPAQFTGEEAGDRVPRPGHIPGARNLFWERLIVSTSEPRLQDEATLRTLFREAGAEPGRTVVTYCRTGMQSSFAYFVARYLGYETRKYDGSFVDWSPREGYPVEQGS